MCFWWLFLFDTVSFLQSPYATDFPDQYKVALPRPTEMSTEKATGRSLSALLCFTLLYSSLRCFITAADTGRQHFDQILACTTKEQKPSNTGAAEHLVSGYHRIDRPTGRLPVEPAKHDNPNDGK